MPHDLERETRCLAVVTDELQQDAALVVELCAEERLPGELLDVRRAVVAPLDRGAHFRKGGSEAIRDREPSVGHELVAVALSGATVDLQNARGRRTSTSLCA